MDLEDTDNLTIFAPTEKGKAELKSGSTQLSTIALELMVMFDGKSPISAIAKRVPGARPGQIGEAVTALLRDKLIDIVKAGATPASSRCRSAPCPTACRTNSATRPKKA
jgi:hypothetical protein